MPRAIDLLRRSTDESRMSPRLPPVYIRPAWNSGNAFVGTLADALVAQGVDVRELGYARSDLPRAPAILLYHWPDEFFRARNWRLAVHALRSLLRLRRGKRRYGQRVLWLAHNVQPHARDGIRLDPVRDRFLRLLDGVIFLSESSREQIHAAYPGLRALPALVVPHGHYRDSATAPATMPATATGRPVRLGFVGRVQRYKGAERLARLMTEIPAQTAELCISGKCAEPELGAELEAAALATSAVRLDLRFLPDAELEQALDAADVLVLPYRDILNSGSALHALSRNRPVIAPRLGSLAELQAQVGERWLWLYDGDLDAATLSDAIRWVRETERDAAPDLSANSWDRIGAAFAQYLRGFAG